ncbi:ribonuclease III [Alteromonadaceae bacterium BrNp21-10]|nr:ribonuclease III [Alteromonadaceae bacterium BrNp21-10]
MSARADVSRLFSTLGYQFKEVDNLRLAMTHRSAKGDHNERLEYLGDAVLGMVVAEALFKRFPKQPEGNLTRMRASLVKGDTLAEIGLEFNLGDYLQLGPGELKSGGFRRKSILADAVEAIIGAIFLEAGIETCKTLILQWLGPRIAALDPDEHLKDHKTRLQEFLQGRQLPLPVYEIVDVQGKDHDQTFVVECQVEGIPQPIKSTASSRRKAEQRAAALALESLNNG